MGPVSPIAVNNPVAFALIIKNGGHSTADIADANVTISIGAYDLTKTPTYVAGNNSILGQIVFGADFHATFRPHDPFRIYSAEQVAGLQNGTIRLFIYGYISYTDDFTIRGPNTVGFCAYYNRLNTEPLGPFDTCNNKNYIYRR